jgi:hypothetical protein
MGQSQSSSSSSNNLNNLPFSELINYIATDYILSMNYKNLKKLHDISYCNKLTGLTSKLVEQYSEDKDIYNLIDRLEQKERNADNEVEGREKQQICQKISVFYVKIAHIFSAIMMTVNPPNETLCDSRINTLSNLESSMKRHHKHPKLFTSMDTRILKKEPGIRELISLYYDDHYDYKIGNFTGMSNETRKQYDADLNTFYLHFTGNLYMPNHIKKFSDIRLRDYDKLPDLKKPKNKDNEDKDNLFIKYSTNLKEFVTFTHDKQKELLNIINKIFVISDNNHIRISPKMNEINVDEILEETRNLIIELYVKCEDYFDEGIKIQEAIVESIIFDTTHKQIAKLKELKHQPYKKRIKKKGIKKHAKTFSN